jgi:hypothetical protein
VLFSSDLWKQALESYASDTHLSVKLFDADQRVVFGPPEWVLEAWDWLLRKELGLACKEPAWLELPAMMRMGLSSPNVMRQHRPEWLSPFNFFLFPLLSDLGGYPAGCDRSNFRFITPFSTDREKWKTLEGINILDGQNYQIGMSPNGKQDKPVAPAMVL